MLIVFLLFSKVLITHDIFQTLYFCFNFNYLFSNLFSDVIFLPRSLENIEELLLKYICARHHSHLNGSRSLLECAKSDDNSV